MPKHYRWTFAFKDDPDYKLQHTMGFRASNPGKGRPTSFLQEREHQRDALEEAEERKKQEEQDEKNLASRPLKLQKFFQKDPQEGGKGKAKGSVEPIAHTPQRHESSWSSWSSEWWQSWSDWRQPSRSAWDWGWHAQ